MSDDIQVPVIEICNGWTVDEIETFDDCDDAFAVLTGLVASIECRMDELAEQGLELSAEHRHAKRALRWKKAALSVVNTKRSRLSRKQKESKEESINQRILNFIAAAHPEVMDSAIAHARAGLEAKVGSGGMGS